ATGPARAADGRQRTCTAAARAATAADGLREDAEGVLTMRLDGAGVAGLDLAGVAAGLAPTTYRSDTGGIAAITAAAADGLHQHAEGGRAIGDDGAAGKIAGRGPAAIATHVSAAADRADAAGPATIAAAAADALRHDAVRPLSPGGNAAGIDGLDVAAVAALARAAGGADDAPAIATLAATAAEALRIQADGAFAAGFHVAVVGDDDVATPGGRPAGSAFAGDDGKAGAARAAAAGHALPIDAVGVVTGGIHHDVGAHGQVDVAAVARCSTLPGIHAGERIGVTALATVAAETRDPDAGQVPVEGRHLEGTIHGPV